MSLRKTGSARRNAHLLFHVSGSLRAYADYGFAPDMPTPRVCRRLLASDLDKEAEIRNPSTTA